MGQKAIRNTKLTDSLTLSECKDGFWLYDYERGMNLAMHVKTETEALVKAITYYQKRCSDLEKKKKKLYDNVNSFIQSLTDNDEIYMSCDCDEC